MPIKGLTHAADIRPRLPRLGKLRKGGEKTSKGFGPDLDHFRFTSDNAKIEQAFAARFGKTPNSLVVYMPYQTLDENFPTWAEVWGASGLEHRCDGEFMAVWREGSKMVRGRKPCMGGHKEGDYRKDSVGRLEVVIPELLVAGFVGTVTMETHALNDIAFIAGVLADVEAKRGSLRGVGFRLYRHKENISVPGWGERSNQRTRVDKWLVKIEPASEWVLHELGQARAEALMLDAPAGEAPQVEAATGEIVPAALLPAPQTAPTPEPQPAGNGQGHERPLAPADLRAFLQRKAKHHTERGRTASEKQRSLVAMLLESFFAGETDSTAKRHALQLALTDCASIKDMPDGMIVALLDWLKPSQDASNDYWPDGMAVREASAVMAQATPAPDEIPF